MTPRRMPFKQYGNNVTILLLVILLLMVLAHIVIDMSQQHQKRVREGQTVFQRMIGEAAQVRPEYISGQLLAVDTNNPDLKIKTIADEMHIKVAAWVTQADYKTYYEKLVGKEQGGVTPEVTPRVWVTLAPQVQQFCKKFLKQKDVERTSAAFRLKQYLGLNPHRSYARFVEFWVKPDDLFRPCPDPETSDASCELTMNLQNPPEVKNVPDYPAFFRQLVTGSYGPDGAPWTRLGYTFDWIHGQRNVGASEYMLVPETHYLVTASFSTDEYCKP